MVHSNSNHFFSQSDCNNPLRMTHFCSNDSISRIKSITLVNACDLEHCVSWAVLPSIWKQRYYFTGGGSFWPGLWVLFLCWYCSESDPNKILGNWCGDTVIVSFGSFKGLFIVITQKTKVAWCSDTGIVFPGSLKRLSIIITQQNMGPWFSDTVIFLYGIFKQLSIIINRNIWNQCVFWVWVGCRFFLMVSEGLSSRKNIVIECVSAVNDFY